MTLVLVNITYIWYTIFVMISLHTHTHTHTHTHLPYSTISSQPRVQDVCLYQLTQLECFCGYGCIMNCSYRDHSASSARPFFFDFAISFLLKPEMFILNMKTMFELATSN